MIGEHRQRYELRYDELGPGGHFPTSVLVGVLQQAAIDGSAARGYPFEHYVRAGTCWVMRRIVLRHERPVRFGDALDVTTWVSRVGRTSPTREFRITSAASDAVVARVRTHWVYLDSATAQPTVIPDALRAAFAPTGESQEPVLPPAAAAAVPPDEVAWREARTVEPGDVDVTGHLRCCRYLGWLEDLLARVTAASGGDARTVAVGSFDLHLLAAASLGDRVELSARTGSAWRVEMSAASGRQLAQATLWPRRLDAAAGTFTDIDLRFPAHEHP